MRNKFLIVICICVLAGFASFAQSAGNGKVVPVAEHYPGGKEALLADIQKNMIYPPMAKRNRIHGECVVAFTLEENGKMVNHKLIKNIGAGCGDEAMRIVRALKFNAPGYRVDATVPVRFDLPK
ncbi:energy transducer TonB [Rhodocytophaga rosea]|uniref:Energy transducer TonB n=1 Tax=Rhodocytophaga rosea TaxID=2704465 RepID=A0A6C0GCP9_9BACT|nr:energy transducer TonB [Rhodocytophaga rosea]QHT65736.1 energy transducer TonB [Rhodocytophaga rosea]